MPNSCEFRSLAAALFSVPEPDLEQSPTAAHEVLPEEQPRELEPEVELLRELRLFNARVKECVEAAVETIVRDIACDVLARELRLAPANLQAIADRAFERYHECEPLRIRVHPSEAHLVSCEIPTVPDTQLRTGDAMLELRFGSVDATLGVRLSSVLCARA